MPLPYNKENFYRLCAIVLLLTVIWWISVKSGVRRTASASVNIGSNHSCRSLFTITQVPHLNILAAARLLQNSARNTTNNESLPGHTWASPHYISTQNHFNMSDAIRVVEHLLHKRTSLSGASTEDYRRLAALLPTLLFFQDNINTGQDNNSPRKEASTASLRFFSRIGAMGGVLPYVPCVIAPFYDPTIITTCFRKRLEKDSLWIAFMGDSKVRELFYELLLRTDSSYYYTIHFLNRTESWEEVRKTSMALKMKEDMIATTETAPRMRITYSFRSFSDLPSNFNTTKELLELGRWASGEEKPPDLLIVGYTSWMMQRMLNRYPNNVLSFLMQMHQQVAPLLEQISQRTRVLLLTQSRFRPHSVHVLFNMRTAFGDAMTDWSEMSLLYYLQQYREQQASQAHPTLLALSQEYHPNGDSSTPTSARAQAQTNLDYMSPSQTGGGVWWWDTGVPLNMAEISECEELYRRALVSHPLYSDNYFRCPDPQHAGRASLSDMITMLLNLVCNSVINTDDTVCCA